MSTLIQNGIPIFTDIDGDPLEDGYIYIGEAGLNPLSNPLQAYWDAGLTNPASNIRTKGGAASNNGTPSRLYVATNYSILVQDKKQRTVYSVLNSVDYYNSPSGDLVAQTDTIATLREIVPVDNNLKIFVKGYYSVKDVSDMPPYFWDQGSVLDDNGGSVIKPTSIDPGDPGRWKWSSAVVVVKASWFGAIGTTDDRVFIQNAIDSAPEELDIDGDYLVTVDPSSPGVSGVYSAASVCLSLSNPIKITGKGKIKLKDGEGSGVASGAIIGNPTVKTINGKVEIDCEIDGNSANTFGSLAGVLIIGIDHAVASPNTYIHDVTLHGFMVRPNDTQAGQINTVFEIDHPLIDGCGGIGIQATRITDFLHYGSRVYNCTDNGIDCFGNDSGGTNLDPGFFGKAIIKNAIIENAASGIFIESFSDWQITDFDLRGCGNGILANRINTGALYGTISEGKIVGDDLQTKTGVKFKNFSGYCRVDNIDFDNLLNSITIDRLSTTGADRLYIGEGNTHRRIAQYIVGHETNANAIIKSTILDQYMYEEGRSAEGYPQLTPPWDHPDYYTSFFKVFRGNLKSIAGGVSFLNDFGSDEVVLTSPGSWGGAYSLYNIGSDGETRINTSPDIVIPKYIGISGVAYYCVSSGTAGEYYVRQWDGTTATAGDYTAVLNSDLTVSVKLDEFANI